MDQAVSRKNKYGGVFFEHDEPKPLVLSHRIKKEGGGEREACQMNQKTHCSVSTKKEPSKRKKKKVLTETRHFYEE